MSKIVEIEDSKVNDLFSKLDQDELNKMIFGAIKRGAYVLKQNTIRTLKSSLIRSTVSSGKPVEEGVRMKGNKNYVEANVNIMGDYRLIFLEKGTKIRTTKKGANRGQISPRNFFADARSNDTAIYDAIEKHLQKSLSKIKS